MPSEIMSHTPGATNNQGGSGIGLTQTSSPRVGAVTGILPEIHLATPR